MTQPPGVRAPETTAIEVPAGSEFDQSRDDVQAELPKAEATPDAPAAPRVEAPQPDDLSSIDPADTLSAALPETGGGQEELTAPKAGETTGGVEVDTDSPVLPSPQAKAPAAPNDEETLSISTEPAQPPQPELPEEDLSISTEPAQPQMPDAGEEETAFPVPSQNATPEGDTVMVDQGSAADSTADESAEEKATDETSTEYLGRDVADGSVADDVAQPQTDKLAAIDTTPAPAPQNDATDEEEGAEQDSDTNVLAAVPEAEITADEPVASGTIDDLAPEVTTNRLPSVVTTPEAEDAAIATEAGDDAKLPPLQRNAVTFENPEDKPLMSIVLIDDGNSPIGLDALKSFPYPLSFAVDTGWQGAPDAVKTYRDAGFEVLAMIDLPPGSGAVDTEVAMQDHLSKIPEAVAVMEGQGSGLQSSREASAQLAEILRDSGHGVVMLPNGLNTAQKLIAREGVPALSVFRDFDAKGQNATVIRRFLDQAAFKAGQEEEGVIMVGRLRADTISALLLWGLQDRANRVALAPVSAVLTAK